MEQVFTPLNRWGWWGGLDRRPRCLIHDKVTFGSQEAAERSAAKATARGYAMHAYRGKCGHWHVATTRR